MLMPGSMAEMHQGYLAKTRANGRLTIANQVRGVEARRKDGTTFPAELSVTQMSIRGEPMFTGLVRDITARVHARDRRAALETQLRQAQKMESLGTLAGGIAHEFNNMLVPMTGLTEMAMTELSEASRAHQNLAKVLESGHRASNLVEKILSFSRIDAVEQRS